GKIAPGLLDLRHAEAGVHVAVPLPEDHAAAAQLRDAVATQVVERPVVVPERHLLVGNAELERRIAAEVLIGEEEDPLTTGERPLDHRAGVAGGANDAAVAPYERLQRRRGVDVGDGHDAVDPLAL